MTEAEHLFERFCREAGVECRRIGEGPTKTPDYEVRVGGLLVAVEVKQLEPNADDTAKLEKLQKERRVSGWENMERPRQSILDATRQLRAHAKGVMPGVCVLYDTVGGLFGYLDSDNIAQCLYGAERYHYVVPDYEANPQETGPELIGVSLGGRRIATPEHNTTLSAVAVLRSGGSAGQLSMAVFHNCYAAIPLPPESFSLPNVTHFVYRSSVPGAIPEWAGV